MHAEREAAKYSFLKIGLNLLEALNIKIEDLTQPGYAKAVERGKERVIQAILKGEISAELTDPQIELLSYPIAAMFVTLIGDPFLNRRYALAEAVRAYNLLQREPEEKIIQIAIDEFNWDIHRDPENIDGETYALKISFHDYLRVAVGFHEPKWKLVNRKMVGGYVSITGVEAARLMQVEVENWVNEKIANPSKYPLPRLLEEKLDEICRVFAENRQKLSGSGLPDEVVNEAFPPCINYCLEGLLAGRRASHMERFALTSFLVNIGMSIDQMVSLYTSVTDFDESLTRYQIEHIAGMKGNRTKYTPPNCNTLRTHGICRNPDALCNKISHPLNYYRRKAWALKKKAEEKAEKESKAANTIEPLPQHSDNPQ